MILGREAGSPLRILCLGAHSDDIELGCGGAMLTLLAAHPGSRVLWVVFSGSDVRAAEARASAADFLAGAKERDVRTLAFRESYFPSQVPEIKPVFETLSAFEPDLVFSHRGADLHQDHRTIAELTWNTFRDHVILEYEIPKYDGDLGRPNLYVPVTAEQAARKVEVLMSSFRSQASKGWFTPDTFEALLRLRGIEAASPTGRAEAFHAPKTVVRF